MSAQGVKVTRDQGLVTITVAGRVAIQFWTRVEADAVAIVDAFTSVTVDPLRVAFDRGVRMTLNMIEHDDLEYSRVNGEWFGEPPKYRQP